MKEFKKILFPVDFSEASEKILPYVQAVAKKFEAKIHILFAARVFEYFTSIYVPHPSINKFEKEIIDGAEKRRNVATCYSAFDRFFPVCGLFDLTEGIYQGNPETPYEQAEANQLDNLLDQVRCEPGRRVLNLGCGYGTLLERIRQVSLGFTNSCNICKAKGSLILVRYA